MRKMILLPLMILIFIVPGQAERQISYLDFINTARSCPGVANAIANIDNYHIGVTIVPTAYATSDDLADAISTLLILYNIVLQYIPSYNGYLRIGVFYKDSQNMAIYEASAIETRSSAKNGYLDSQFIRNVIQKEKMVHYYVSDQWGDVTKNVWVGGSSASPSVGNWL